MESWICCLCSEMDDSLRISLLRHSELPLMGAGVDDMTLVVGVNGSRCGGLQAVDFDEDGDVDLIVGGYVTRIVQQMYFERTSQAVLVERTGNQNPINIFGGNIKAIADIDGDGRLEVVMQGWIRQNEGPSASQRLRYFRRTEDNSFVEPAENPVAGFSLYSGECCFERLFCGRLEFGRIAGSDVCNILQHGRANIPLLPHSCL